MKKIGLMATVAVAFGMFLCSCEGTENPRAKAGTPTNATAVVIEKHINDMESQPWDKNVYLDIRQNQIDCFKGGTKAKQSLYDLLDYTYGIVLVREGHAVLDMCDASRHSHLKSLMTELKSFPKAKDIDKLNARYNKHEEMMNFIASLSAKQKVNSLNDKYDVAFEKEKEKKAKEYLATSPTCKHITAKLGDTKTFFKNRRKDYADKLVNLYCNQDSYDQTVELRVKGNINSACGSLTSAQSQKMSDFKEKMQKEATSAAAVAASASAAAAASKK